MKQDNNGGTNYQTQTGPNNTNFFVGNDPHPQPHPSLEEIILAEYHIKAGELIAESYARNYESVIDDRCNDRLEKLQRGSPLAPEKARDVNEEILKLCESYGEPFKHHMQDLKLTIQKHGASSYQVNEWLNDCPKFFRDEQFVGTACSLVGYQMYIEGAIEDAFKFINKLIKRYPDSPLAYITQGLIYCKKGNLKRALKIIRSARDFYEQQGNRVEEITHFKGLEQVLYQLIQQEPFWNRFRGNIAHIVEVTAKFFLLG